MSATCGCGVPLQSTAICTTCSQRLCTALSDVSGHWRDLDTVKGRATRYGGTGGGRGGDKPLPVDARFLGAGAEGSVLQETVKSTVATWTRLVLEAIGGTVSDNIPACTAYLQTHVDWISTQHWAPEILDEVTFTAELLRKIVDRPADRWFAGPCDQCATDLYAKAGASWVRCDPCDIQYNVDERRAHMLEAAHDHLATASEISRAVSWLDGQPLSAERIRKWAQRGRITRKGWTLVRGRELPTYRLGDVAQLATDTKAG